LTCIKASRADPRVHGAKGLTKGDIMAIAHAPARLSISGLGWGFSAALVVLFVLCLLSALFLPMRIAHGWVALFSDAPLRSTRVWIDGLVWSIVAGWLIALVFGTVYNWIVARRAIQSLPQ
jgi:hypothetical protein